MANFYRKSEIPEHLQCYFRPAEIGLEATPAEYVARLVAVFREVRRVLHPTGTFWLNLGDSYAGSWGAQSRPNGTDNGSTLEGGSMLSARQIAAHPRTTGTGSTKRTPGLKPKDLMMMPARVALALQADGWWLRSAITWCKRAPMPESITDRPTSATEMVFLLTKSQRYYYDAEAVREAALYGRREWSNAEANLHRAGGDTERIAGLPGATVSGGDPSTGRNMWNYWLLSQEPYPDAHFATFPTEVPRRAIAAGSSEKGCCSTCRAPWVRVVEREHPGDRGKIVPTYEAAGVLNQRMHPGEHRRGASSTTGWRPTCAHPGDPVPCVVLDPFAGAGTTLMQALRMGRRAIGIELNPDYVTLARDRIIDDAPLLNRVPAEFEDGWRA